MDQSEDLCSFSANIKLVHLVGGESRYFNFNENVKKCDIHIKLKSDKLQLLGELVV